MEFSILPSATPIINFLRKHTDVIFPVMDEFFTPEEYVKLCIESLESFGFEFQITHKFVPQDGLSQQQQFESYLAKTPLRLGESADAWLLKYPDIKELCEAYEKYESPVPRAIDKNRNLC